MKSYLPASAWSLGKAKLTYNSTQQSVAQNQKTSFTFFIYPRQGFKGLEFIAEAASSLGGMLKTFTRTVQNTDLVREQWNTLKVDIQSAQYQVFVDDSLVLKVDEPFKWRLLQNLEVITTGGAFWCHNCIPGILPIQATKSTKKKSALVTTELPSTTLEGTSPPSTTDTTPPTHTTPKKHFLYVVLVLTIVAVVGNFANLKLACNISNVTK